MNCLEKDFPIYTYAPTAVRGLNTKITGLTYIMKVLFII